MKTNRILFIISMLLATTGRSFGSDKVMVNLTSNPEFADVFIDGKFICISPCNVELEKGKYTVVMKHQLKGSLEKEIEVKENGEVQSFYIESHEKKIKHDSDYYNSHKNSLFEKPPLSKKRNKIYYSILSIITTSVGLYYIKNKLEQKGDSTIFIKSK